MFIYTVPAIYENSIGKSSFVLLSLNEISLNIMSYQYYNFLWPPADTHLCECDDSLQLVKPRSKLSQGISKAFVFILGNSFRGSLHLATSTLKNVSLTHGWIANAIILGLRRNVCNNSDDFFLFIGKRRMTMGHEYTCVYNIGHWKN